MENLRHSKKKRQLLQQSNSFLQCKSANSEFVLMALFANYDYVKKFAIERLFEKTEIKLDTILRMYQSGHLCERLDEDLTNNVYSWTIEDFRKRSQLPNLVWLDIMLMKSDICLNVYKFQQDVEQLVNFLEKIFYGFLAVADNKDENITETVIKPISEASHVLDVTYKIDKELNSNYRQFWELCHKDTFIQNIKRESVEQMRRLYMETKIMSSHIWMPIELRYHLEWYNSKVNQVKYSHDSLLNAKTTEIDKTHNMIDTERKVNSSCLDFYYITIGEMKSQIEALQNKFDTECDEIDSRIFIRRSRIDKLRDEWKFRAEEIERFHYEINLYNRRQQEEAEEKELKKAMNMKAATAASKKSKGKKDKKAKEKAFEKSNVSAKAVTPKTPAKKKKK